MRWWPLVVSYAVFEDVCRQRDAERERYDKLLDLVLKLKPGGAIVHTVAAGAPAVVSPAESAIDRAINNNKYARRDPNMKAHLRAYATKQLDQGISEAAVLRTLLTWDNLPDATGLEAQPVDPDTVALVM